MKSWAPLQHLLSSLLDDPTQGGGSHLDTDEKDFGENTLHWDLTPLGVNRF